MPCRKESFLLLEQSVSVDSKEVDSLVARIGEALQLNAHRAPTSCSMALKPPPPAITRSPAAMCSCVRGRTTPYRVCTPRGAARYHHQHTGGARHCLGGTKQLCGRGWVRGSFRKHGGQDVEEGDDGEDPHQLLQELLLSGNLIKEAVRRLNLTGEGTAPCKVPEATETLVQ
ncbi:GSK-3-binding protein-like [Hyla sarda]|uniref:GSK-3-binding protein-like n=1 Tax=Hyla sarda TaxID=327740 RepID=UPI0024C3F96B|nr:GSK-3-binding protein-like [Hyla sarda]